MTETLSPEATPYTGHFSTPAGQDDYERLILAMSARLRNQTDEGRRPLFSCGLAEDFWDIYLSSFTDPADRQYHNCHTCRRWFQQYSDLVVINEDGTVELACWPDPATFDRSNPYHLALFAIHYEFGLRTRNLRLTAFFDREPIWGTPVTGDWHHFHLIPPRVAVHDNPVRTPNQARANFEENVRTVRSFLLEHPPERFDQALDLLRSGGFASPEKHIAALEWLRDRRRGPNLFSSPAFRLAVRLAPDGYCHPRAGIIGLLMDDLAAGRSVEQIRRRHGAAMDPLAYQRPKAPPAAGTIDQAEKLVAQLGIAASLARRFASPAEILPRAFWTPPAPPTPPEGGVFAHLRETSPKPLTSSQTLTMTWAKFSSQVLPSASSLELQAIYGSWMGFTTAVDPEAPPILQWDDPQQRNPVAWYLKSGGSSPGFWGLANGWLPVIGITSLPCHWDRPFTHFRETTILLVDGGKDSHNNSSALFPETLRSELHSVRSVIEAHSRRTPLVDIPGPQAVGWEIVNSCPVRLRVTTESGLVSKYIIDRRD